MGFISPGSQFFFFFFLDPVLIHLVLTHKWEPGIWSSGRVSLNLIPWGFQIGIKPGENQMIFEGYFWILAQQHLQKQVLCKYLFFKEPTQAQILYIFTNVVEPLRVFVFFWKMVEPINKGNKAFVQIPYPKANSVIK